MCTTTARVQLVLPVEAASPGVARAFLRATGCTAHASQLEEALLLVTELVTNAVRYGAPVLLLSVECDDGLHVSVRDGGERLPRQRDASGSDEVGRGMALVETLSEAWGVQPVSDEHGPGKSVWFALSPPG